MTEITPSEQTAENSRHDEQQDMGRPPRCLSFTVSGPWAHFRRVEGNIVKQTYRIIPRTTVAGLVAAMLGVERDGYYDRFEPTSSAIAIEPTARLRTLNMPINTLSTANESLRSLNPRGKISMKLPDPSKHRQQHNYEVLVDPAYRIDLWLADEDWYDDLRTRLKKGTSHYVPSLGLSEHLAKIEYHGEFEVLTGPSTDEVTVDSAVPNASDQVVPDPGVQWQMEQSPAFMTADDEGRRTTAFTTYAYNPDVDGPQDGSLVVRGVTTSTVDGRTVMFV